MKNGCNCGTWDHKHEPRCDEQVKWTAQVNKKDWPNGLFCAACGERIPWGDFATWSTEIGQPEAYHVECGDHA